VSIQNVAGVLVRKLHNITSVEIRREACPYIQDDVDMAPVDASEVGEPADILDNVSVESYR
jgi:hypothetical protein